jgi:hypothetical protein
LTHEGWVEAGSLTIGDQILSLDGTYGDVESISISNDSQVMYNLTVDISHTFAVGEGQWVVHNCNTKPISDIRYTQSSISPGGNTRTGTYTLTGNANLLRTNPDFDLPAIRVFTKTSDVVSLPPMTRYHYTGNPGNLENNMIYTLDNRRLYSYRLAGRENIPVEILDPSNPNHLNVIKEEVWKFTTVNWGEFIRVLGRRK